jgi:hypothetical protein
MYTFTISYSCKYQLSFAPNYKWSTCGKCYNSKTCRLIKQIIKGGSIGYIINGKFYTLSNLREKLERIPVKEILPF